MPRLCLLAALALCAGSAFLDDGGELIDVSWGRRLAVNELQEAAPEHLDVSFTASRKSFQLRLRLNRALLPATARHVLQRANGSKLEGPMPKPCFYVGEVAGDTSGSAGLSTCTGGLSGLVLAHGVALSLEPLRAGEDKRHVARAISNRSFLDMEAAVSRFARGANTSQKGRRLVGTDPKHVEVFVFNDNRRYQGFGGQSGLPQLADHSVSVMNAVTAVYRNPPSNGASFSHAVQVVLVGLHTFLDTDPWENKVDYLGQETEVSSLLSQFNEWGQTSLSASETVPYDNRVLLSGRNFDGNTVGLAGVSTMCSMPRSGSVNMCGATAGDVAHCAAVVAHEMGHNFGMRHDSSGNGCPQSGFVMEAVGGSTATTQFSSCSTNYITNFFTTSYPGNGQCLENLPTRVVGDPICRNGFVEEGEDCDCGQADCSGVDPCCDGSTCKFADPSYQCSAAAGPCCESCRIVGASANKVCRPQLNECDLEEHCAGDSAECPLDVFVYPGRSCTINGFSGLCSSGRCESLESTCKVDITRDFDGNWDQTERCYLYNDECNQLVCHMADQAEDYRCGQNFATHGKQMTVPDGTPCWFPASALNQRVGMCYSGKCSLPHSLAIVPKCGNGGIDLGEECDCGAATTDTCCDCATCKLKAGKQCSSTEPCCDAACQFKAAGTVCRAASGECDIAEVCSGSRGHCPSDVGKKWGTSCTATDGFPSTCYAKVCMDSLSMQCAQKTGGERPFGNYGPDRLPKDSSLCTALSCCRTCEQQSWTGTLNGVPVTNPYVCNQCLRSTSYTEFTVNGVTNRIYLGGALDGTIIDDPSKVCVEAAEVTPSTSCPAGQFLEISVGRCLTCDSACTECSGPSNFDCVGGCRFGADTRGACAISAEQTSFGSLGAPSPSPVVPSPSAAPSPSSVAPSPAPPGFTDGTIRQWCSLWLALALLLGEH